MSKWHEARIAELNRIIEIAKRLAKDYPKDEAIPQTINQAKFEIERLEIEAKKESTNDHNTTRCCTG
jgi:hypothetical protein